MRVLCSARSDKPLATSPCSEVVLGLSCLSGLLFLVSFPPFDLGPLVWVALVPVLLLRHLLPPIKLLLAGYVMAAVPVAGIAYNVAVFHLGAFVLLTLGVPAAFAIGVVTADKVEHSLTCPWMRLLVFPALAVSVEYVLSNGFGIPATIALTQAKTPHIIQSADLFGTAGVTFLIILVNCGVGEEHLSAGRREGRSRRK